MIAPPRLKHCGAKVKRLCFGFTITHQSPPAAQRSKMFSMLPINSRIGVCLKTIYRQSVRCVSYVQGQTPEFEPNSKVREYFYYIDHQGQVSLFSVHLFMSFSTCKSPVFGLKLTQYLPALKPCWSSQVCCSVVEKIHDNVVSRAKSNKRILQTIDVRLTGL